QKGRNRALLIPNAMFTTRNGPVGTFLTSALAVKAFRPMKDDIPHLQSIIRHYQQTGFLTAIDDFGAGYAGLNLLADLQTDLIKLDMALIRDIHRSHSRQAIVRGILQVCRDLSIRVVAEGVETREEFVMLRNFGVELFQGYYFAKPAFQSLAQISAAKFD
ncbi:MAG: EAL domain-containing protein, partial [Cyanobacteria bacterium J06639_1]